MSQKEFFAYCFVPKSSRFLKKKLEFADEIPKGRELDALISANFRDLSRDLVRLQVIDTFSKYASHPRWEFFLRKGLDISSLLHCLSYITGSFLVSLGLIVLLFAMVVKKPELIISLLALLAIVIICEVFLVLGVIYVERFLRRRREITKMILGSMSLEEVLTKFNYRLIEKRLQWVSVFDVDTLGLEIRLVSVDQENTQEKSSSSSSMMDDVNGLNLENELISFVEIHSPKQEIPFEESVTMKMETSKQPPENQPLPPNASRSRKS